MSTSLTERKSFEISKREVWQAYERVKANKGAPGVGGVTIGEFEADLRGNLYKVWNRMSSGSYFPGAGPGSGDTQEGRDEGPRDPERGRSDCPDGSGFRAGAGRGTRVP